jgi:hypothetical protein
MTKMILAAACLAACALGNAQATVVQQGYTAYITGIASPTGTGSVGSQALHVGDAVTGFFSYDNALVGTLPSPFSPIQASLNYTGSVADNHITVDIAGNAAVTAPVNGGLGCSATSLDPANCATPEVMRRWPGPILMGQQATDVLSLIYTPAFNPGPLWTVPDANTPVRVSSVQLDFFYPAQLTGNGLPTQIRLEDLRFSQMTLNLSDGAGVFVRVFSIAEPVPEAGTLATMGLGLVGLLGVLQRRRAACTQPA